MRVTQIIWDLDQGGAQRYLADLVGQLAANNEVAGNVLVLTTRGALSQELEAHQWPVKYAGMRSGFDLGGLLRVFRYLKDSRVELVHSHSNSLAIAVLLRLLGCPVVYTEHGGCLLRGRRRDRVIYSYLHAPIRRFVAISHEMAKAMCQANPTVSPRIQVVHNGVSLKQIDAMLPVGSFDAPKGWFEADHRVGIVGRLVPQKGIGTFLTMAAEVAKGDSGTVFAIIGDGPMRGELESQARELGIAERVLFMGYRRDAIRFVKTFDVFVLTSDFEPFGLVVTEAMACGVPVVALNQNSAVSEIIDDGVQGFLVNEKDARIIANRVTALLRDPVLRSRMGQLAQQKVADQFTIATNAARIQEIYRACGTAV